MTAMSLRWRVAHLMDKLPGGSAHVAGMLIHCTSPAHDGWAR